MPRLVLLRHAQSTWNLENRFTGWTDVDLTERGVEEAELAAARLAERGFVFDQAHTSVLVRAIRTLDIILERLKLRWIPVHKSWRLNERHYGALQGLDKSEIATRYGADKVHRWRRGYRDEPPALAEDDERHPRFDPRYARFDPGLLPRTESLADCQARLLPYWLDALVPQILSGERLIVSCHGNTVRALVKYLDGLDDATIEQTEIPTGQPLVYEFDQRLTVTSRYYLDD